MTTGKKSMSHLEHDKPCMLCGKMERVIYYSTPRAYCAACLRAFNRASKAGLSRAHVEELFAQGVPIDDIPQGWRQRWMEKAPDLARRALPGFAPEAETEPAQAPERSIVPNKRMSLEDIEPQGGPVDTADTADTVDDQAVQGLLAQLLLLTDHAREVIGAGKIEQLRAALDVDGVRVQFGASRIAREGDRD